jgi:hypothetical protein
MSIFGFPDRPEGGDFLPIVKYDARAGRLFRIDSVQTAQGWDRTPVDITNTFKALFDFENVQVGWIDFTSGGTPSFVLVPYPGNKLPDKPGNNHKHGLRFVIKLAKDCAGSVPIREMAGTSARFLAGIEALYKQYAVEKAAHPGELPAVILESTMPVTSGSGQKSSTNYQPNFKIVGWAPRGDIPNKVAATQTQANGQANGQQQGAAPATGSQQAAPPPKQVSQSVEAGDFG